MRRRRPIAVVPKALMVMSIHGRASRAPWAGSNWRFRVASAIVLTATLALGPLGAPGVGFPLVAASSTSTDGTGDQHVVTFTDAGIPDDLPERIAALGGHVIATIPEVGTAAVAGLNSAAARAL